MQRRTATAILTAAALACACARRAGEALTLSGSTSLQPLAEKWVEEYGVKHPQLSLAVQGGGSTAGIQAALSGAAQIGLVSREPTVGERGRISYVSVARDGIALVVHPSNVVSDLTLNEARDLYSGRTATWRGGAGAPAVTLITREEGSGTRAAFETLVMRGARIAPGALVQDSTGAVRQMVASDPAAIGYLSLGLVDGSVKALRLNGVAATEQNIEQAVYPLTRPCLFALRGQPDPETQRFIAWVRGPEGAAITRRAGFLPVPSEVPRAKL
jgi:phosphate transport system substrate-binding protein